MSQKTVVLGVTGCIGAYKAPYIVRGLQKAGLRVRVVMTENATRFIGPLTFEALTHEPVLVDMFAEDSTDPIPHISLANAADLMVVAPCTANTLAKLASGVADDLLSSAVLAMHCPVLVAPAANVHMYQDESTQDNIAIVKNRGWRVVEGEEGYLACGDEGQGRLADPEDIVSAALEMMQVNPDLDGRHVMITAGPTHEAIDPVRFITNHSSGKTGYALAEAARDRGARVTLVAGPTRLEDPAGVEVVQVESALEMLDACMKVFPDTDIAVFSAAVSDLRPSKAFDHKLKKDVDLVDFAHIELTENPDILATLAASKTDKQVVVGYAAETENVLENARKKLASKHADFIVANEVGPDKGFGTDTNSVWFVDSVGEEPIGEAGKDHIANLVLDKALQMAAEKDRSQG